IGYLSTTVVYGDRKGRWVFETSPLAAQSLEGARRVGAERDWLEVGRGMGLTVALFRLPGIYGPGRSALDRLRAGEARRIAAPGQVFSRIHVDDLASGLAASITRPRAGGIYNLCDDEPCPNSEVVAYAARLLGLIRRPKSRSATPRSRPRRAASTPRASGFRTPAPRPSSAGGRPIRPIARVWPRSWRWRGARVPPTWRSGARCPAAATGGGRRP